MICGDLMKTDVVLCHENDPVRECARLMREHNVGFLPVVDAEDRVVGVVTDRDLATRIVADPSRDCDTPVHRAMSLDLVTCAIEDDLEDVRAMMAKRKKSRIIAVDGERRCIGIISLSDIGQTDRPERTGELLRAITRREVSASVSS